MVYVDPKNLGYMPYWQKWVNDRPTKQQQDDLTRLFDKYATGSIDMIVEGIMDGKLGEKIKTIVPLTDLNMVTQLGYMLEILLGEKEIEEFDVLEAFFLQALYWSVGAGLMEEGRVKFDNYIKYVASMATKDSDADPAGPGEIFFLDERIAFFSPQSFFMTPYAPFPDVSVLTGTTALNDAMLSF